MPRNTLWRCHCAHWDVGTRPNKRCSASVQYGTRWPAVADPVLAAVSGLRNDSAARFRRAKALVDDGDVTGAIAEFEAALTDDNSLAFAHSSLVKLYGRTGNWAKAEEHYRAALALGSGLAELHYDYGVLLGLQQKWSDAEDAYRRAIAVNPNYPEAHNNLGQVLERNRQLDAALDEYRTAVADRPTFRLARFNAGRMLIALGRLDDAIAELQKLTEPTGRGSPPLSVRPLDRLRACGSQRRGRPLGNRCTPTGPPVW